MEEAIRRLQRSMHGERIKWVDLANLHLTLFFLGETQDSRIDSIIDGLKGVFNKSEPVNIILSGMGLFRNIRDPRVLWIGVDDNPTLQEMHSRIADVLTGFGYQKESRPFRPHLTIGRPKTIHDRKKLMEELEKNRNKFMQKSVVEEVIFYESILRERGPEYRVIETFPLSRDKRT